MKSPLSLSGRTLFSLVVLLAATSSAYATTITVIGSDVTLLSSPNLGATDTTQTGGAVTRTQNSTGALGQFNAELGVLTNVAATLSVPTTTTSLTKVGGGGTATVTGGWSLGGNTSGTTLNTLSNNGGDSTWNSISLNSLPSTLNNFVGTGNIATNNFTTTLSANKTSPNATPATGASVSKSLIAGESVVYAYLTHSNASFTSPSDSNSHTIDFGQLTSGAFGSQGFSIYNLGELGLTDFNVSFLSGNDVFDVTGGNSVSAGSSGLFTALFDGQAPSVLTNYSGIYRLAFTDNVSSLSQYASNSVGTNYIDLTISAAVASATAVPEPQSLALMALGIGVISIFSHRRKTT